MKGKLMTEEEVKIYNKLKNRIIGATCISENGHRVYVKLRDGVQCIEHHQNLNSLRKIDLARIIDRHI